MKLGRWRWTLLALVYPGCTGLKVQSLFGFCWNVDKIHDCCQWVLQVCPGRISIFKHKSEKLLWHNAYIHCVSEKNRPSLVHHGFGATWPNINDLWLTESTNFQAQYAYSTLPTLFTFIWLWQKKCNAHVFLDDSENKQLFLVTALKITGFRHAFKTFTFTHTHNHFSPPINMSMILWHACPHANEVLLQVAGIANNTLYTTGS